MKKCNNKKNVIRLLLMLICLVLSIYEVAFAENTPVFKKIPTNNNIYTIVPADNNITVQKLTGLRRLSESEFKAIANLKPLQFAKSAAPMALPTSVNNANTMYFRPVFNQVGGSCGQASGVGYTFTYEINLARNLSSAVEANQYPHYYTWNFLNDGVGGGSWYFDGWDIIRDNGCPNVPIWGGMTGDNTRWLTGYDNYLSGMHNRVTTYAQITDVNTAAGITNLKHWLYDHGNGSAVGGLACFAVLIDNSDYVNLPAGTPDAGKSMLIKWGNDGYHAMTIVGYNNNVRYDFNGDGQYTNNIDITGDGVVNVSDWEIGAFIFANSWGTGYADNGFCYMAYKSIADADKTGNNALTWNAVHVVMTEPVTNPKMVMKAEIWYAVRNQLNIYATVTQDGITRIQEYESFTNKGGSLPVCGAGNFNRIELGLDVSSLYEQIDPTRCATFNLNVVESDPSSSNFGVIMNYALLDYTSGAPIQTNYPEILVFLNNNTLTSLPITHCQAQSTLNLDYCTYNTNPQSNTLYVNFCLHNTGSTAINLSDCAVKYWYTYEGSGVPEIINVDWAGKIPSGQAIISSVIKNITNINQGGQTRVCTISFSGSAGALQPGETAEVKLRINKSDWSNYTQTNDYSFSANTNYQNWDKITGYYLNALNCGNEP